MKRISYILTLLLAVSCVYPFNPEITGEVEHRLVVSGDILIGQMTKISLGYVFALDGTMKNEYPNARVWVENDGGETFMESSSVAGSHYIDLTGAPADKQYKLHVSVSGGSNYETPWMIVQEAPEITDFNYKAVGDDVQLLLSLEGGDISTAYRWDYEEIWEFHADFIPDYMYVPGLPEKMQENPKYIYRERDMETEDYYYCWASSKSTEYGLATTEGQSANKVIDKNFLNLTCYSTKLQVMYSILIQARGVSKQCYGYLHNMNAISNNTGSLFSPTPSEVRGNVTCVENPDEFVYGYVEATRLSQRRFFIDQNKVHLFKMARDPELQLFFPAADEDGLYNFEQLYISGNAPVKLSDDGFEPTKTNMKWAPTRCSDCRAAGGNKNKPEWWPNQDK